MTRRLATASALTSATLFGAMMLIRVVLVPFWRSSRPSEFKTWFMRYAPRLRATMVPLGVITAATTTTTALATRSRRAAVAALAALGVGLVTAVVNEPLNARFEGPDPIEPTDLLRWIRWHDVRLVLGAIAALASASTLTDATAHD
jgi:Anthrone oxygenase